MTCRVVIVLFLMNLTALTQPHDSEAEYHCSFRFRAGFHGYWCYQTFLFGVFLLLEGGWEDEGGSGCWDVLQEQIGMHHSSSFPVSGDKWFIFLPLP